MTRSDDEALAYFDSEVNGTSSDDCCYCETCYCELTPLVIYCCSSVIERPSTDTGVQWH